MSVPRRTPRAALLLLSLCLAASALPARAVRVSPRAAAARQATQPVRAPGKRALLVGISEYARADDTLKEWEKWENLSSAQDVAALRAVLVSRFGFAEADIRTLTTKKETTHESIVQSFRTFLTEQTREGDIVYFHYSGHGGQALDGPTPDNPVVGDEIDGVDECLIPSDYAPRPNPSRNIRDDEFEKLLDELRQRRPLSVTLTFDSCYSGTITRGGRSVVRGRGLEVPLPEGAAARRTRGGATADGPGGFVSRDASGARGFTLITATRNDQPAQEIEKHKMGVFSYALTGALSNSGPQTTYRDIIERVGERISREGYVQTPQLEGDADKVLLSGASLPVEPYVRARRDSGGRLAWTLEAGAVQGVTKGSRYRIYPVGARQFGSRAAADAHVTEAEVVEVRATSATLSPVADPRRPPLKPEELQVVRAVETERRYGDQRLKVYAEPDAAKAAAAALRDLAVAESAAAADAWDVRVCPLRCADTKPGGAETGGAGPGGLVLQRQDGSVARAIPPGTEQARQLRAALKDEARWRFVNGLVNDAASLPIRVRLRIIPVEVEPDAGRLKVVRDRPATRTAGGQLELAEGDHVVLEISNEGTTDAFVTVLSLDSEGTVGPVWPHPEYPAENKVAAGTKLRLTYPFIFVITKPYGKEVYKAIATAEPADFSTFLDADKALSRAAERPLGRLLRAITLGERSSLGVDPTDWATATETFFVTPRK